MDTFFCKPSANALKAALPASACFEIFAVCGENGQRKQDLLDTLCMKARSRRFPTVRVLESHGADRTAAVCLPLQRRIAVDGDYFSEYLTENSARICFSLHTDTFTDMSRAAECRADCEALQNETADCQARAEALLRTAAQQKQAQAGLLSPYCDKSRLMHAVLRLSESYLPPKPNGETEGRILFHRTLGSVTPWGVHTVYTPFVAPSCTRILLHDPFGGFAPVLLDGFAAACTVCGYRVRVYRCALRGVTEHVTVPSLSLALCTENAAHPFPFSAQRVLCAERFLKPSAEKIPRAAVLRYERTVEFLAEEASFSFYEAAEARHARETLVDTYTDETRFLLAKNLLCDRFLCVRQNDETEK